MTRARRFVTIAVLSIAGLVAAGTPAFAGSTHQNFCATSLYDSQIGTVVAKAGTCDGDNYWRGTVRDDRATSDGYCVSAYLQNILMATSCNSTGVSFTFLDPERNSFAYLKICKGRTTHCIETTNSNF